MKPVALALLLSTLSLGPAGAQPVPPDQAPAAPEAPAASSVEDFARKVNIVTRAKAPTAVPENEPLAVDLGLVDVPGIPARLTRDVTAKGYARHVVVDGARIGQLVMTGVEKKGRVEPLESKDFVAQFTMERPELDPETPVTVEGDEEELRAALERLAATEDEEAPEKDKETETADNGQNGAAGQAGSNATQNPDAASYKTPDALDVATPSDPTIQVTTDGCDVRVDLDQMQAIQQNRIETTEDGQVSRGPCEDGDQRFPIKRSYAACGDLVDIEGRTATAQYLLFYTDAGGSRAEVSDCQPDAEQVFAIVEDRDACTIRIDYTEMQAVPRAALIYANANNNEVQVRGCEASEEVAAVPLVPVTDGCSIRHDFTAGRSYQQGRHVYDLDGVTWQAGTCTDNGTEYPHQKVYDTATGAPVCPPLVDEDSGTVTLQSKVAITVDGVRQTITDCRPDTDTQALVATAEGCTNPATWTHDINAGVSYGRERFYYMHGSARRYVTDCRDSALSYPHQVETVGWQNHDDQLFAYRMETIYIEPPTGRYDVQTGMVRQGAVQEPYVYQGEQEVANGEQWYEDCTRYAGQDQVRSYERPDGSTYDDVVGDAPAKALGEACSSVVAWNSQGIDNFYIYSSQQISDDCNDPEGCGLTKSTVFYRMGNLCTYRGTRKMVREDGVTVSTSTATRTGDANTWTTTVTHGRWDYHGWITRPNSNDRPPGELYRSSSYDRFAEVKDHSPQPLCPSQPPASLARTWTSQLGW